MKQEGADASSVKLNLTFHYSTETGRYRGGGMPDRRVGSPVTVYAQVRVQCREPKTGQQKVQFSNKTKHFACLGILFIYVFSRLVCLPWPLVGIIYAKFNAV